MIGPIVSFPFRSPAAELTVQGPVTCTLQECSERQVDVALHEAFTDELGFPPTDAITASHVVAGAVPTSLGPHAPTTHH